jgi:hypothetical protein
MFRHASPNALIPLTQTPGKRTSRSSPSHTYLAHKIPKEKIEKNKIPAKFIKISPETILLTYFLH